MSSICKTGCGCAEAAGAQKITLHEQVEKYINAVDHKTAYDIAETLAFDEKYLSNALGWRTAGSDAEHRAADYLADKMREIGLTDVEKVAINVDKWQFNDASLTIAGTDVDIMPASYATNGTGPEGITAEIVDVGRGHAADYEGKDVTGKIVVAGADQWNDAWIDKYMNEAKLHGAAAIITYSLDSGYAAFSDDMINMQDLCSKDLMPCVSISRNQYREIAAAIEAGHTEATLKVDNVMQPGEGTAYNVIGKIRGRSSEQQILVAGHYDVYFNGFQDDSCAIGLILAMAQGMLRSGYVPENDIVFVAHASEEWGKIGTQFDWTTGAWEMINHARPEWAGKTIAMFNFELPALYDGEEQ
ncbi:MAG: M28 family peptidase, partial [Eubacteriaceae bacterium]|nr:M28 family peptidase [Eubacteriaceae bacterium]